MASDDILEIVRVLLLADPSQVNVEIRNGERDVPFHLLVARIHHEIQKERFKPLRIQKDYGLAKSSTAGYSSRRNSNTSSSSDDETAIATRGHFMNRTHNWSNSSRRRF